MLPVGTEEALSAEILRGLVIGVVVQSVVAFGLRAWALRVADRAPRWARHVSFLPLVGLCLILIGLVGTSSDCCWPSARSRTLTP
jgi:hypothetical protein